MGMATPNDRINAAIRIQMWFRRHRARLELKRRMAWSIFEKMEYKTERSPMKLLCFYLEMLTISTDHTDEEAVLASASSHKTLQQRLKEYGRADDKNMLQKANFQFVEVEKTYTGPHLTFPLSANHVHLLISSFKAGEKLHARYLMQLLQEARLLLKTRPNITLVSTSISEQVTVVGDLHGRLKDLLTVFDKNGLPDVTNPYVFNGDYIDRGDKSVEVIAILLACLLVWPSAVFLNRGNHEDSTIRRLYGFNNELRNKYELHFSQLDYLFTHVFSWFPLATIIDERVFVTHGGVSDKMDLEVVNNLQRNRFLSPVNLRNNPDNPTDPLELEHVIGLLWNDPKNEPGCTDNTARSIGKLFGPDATARFLKRHQLSMVVRSHQCVPQGYQILHKNALVIVFSASNYNGLNKGAYVKFTSSCKPHFVQYLSDDASFRSMGRRITSVGENALGSLRKKISASKSNLIKAFEKADPKKSRSVTIAQWCSIMKSTLGLDLPWRLLRPHLAELSPSGGVMYMTTFLKITLLYRSKEACSVTEALYKDKEELEAMFRMMDTDCSGYLTFHDFKESCRSVRIMANQKEFTHEEVTELAAMIDLNHDGKINYNEFLEAYRIVEAKGR